MNTQLINQVIEECKNDDQFVDELIAKLEINLHMLIPYWSTKDLRGCAKDLTHEDHIKIITWAREAFEREHASLMWDYVYPYVEEFYAGIKDIRNVSGQYKKSHGTSFQSIVNAKFDDLVRIFGDPDIDEDGDKVKAEWIIEFKDGTIATIYDWKEYDTHYTEVEMWHIGGYNYDAVNHVTNYIEQHK